MTAFRFVLAALVLSAISTLTNAAPGVILLEEQPYHTGKFSLREMDMWVQAKGTPIRLTRTYSPDEGWRWNRRWSNLALKQKQTSISSTMGPGGTTTETVGSPESETETHYADWDYIQREDVKYERVAGQPRFGYFGAYLEATAEGYTWHNRQGDWIKYDTDGVTLSYGDSEGNAYTLLRDGQGRVIGLKDALDRTLITLTYAFSDGDEVKTVTDYTGRTVTYHYDARALVRVTDVRGFDWTYQYQNDRLVRRIDPENHATTYNYDDGRVVEIVHPNGASTAYDFSYDRNGGGVIPPRNQGAQK